MRITSWPAWEYGMIGVNCTDSDRRKMGCQEFSCRLAIAARTPYLRYGMSFSRVLAASSHHEGNNGVGNRTNDDGDGQECLVLTHISRREEENQSVCPGGTFENSPAIYGWGKWTLRPGVSPAGTIET